MLWRLSHSSSLDNYICCENPCSVVLYCQNSEQLCSALCGRLLSRGVDLVILAMNPTRRSSLHEHLRSAHPRRKILHTVVRENDIERSTREFLDLTNSRTITLFIGCVDATLQSGISAGPFLQGASIQLFTELQKLALPHLARNAPSSLLITANTLGYSYVENSEYLKAFASGLSNQLQSHGHDKIQITLMEYFEGAGSAKATSFLSPPPEVLSDSILRAVGSNSTHVIPYWRHEVLAWFIWCLMIILPSSLVIKLAPS